MKTKYLSFAIVALMLMVVSCKKSSFTNHSVAPPILADVCVAGFVNAGHNEAAYWKNGMLTVLTQSPTYAIARSIAVDAGNVYVAGTVSGTANDNAAVWINGALTILGDASVNSQAWGIAVQGTDVYVAGWAYSNTAGTWQAAYWKNGTLNTLTDGYTANAIAVSGTDVYLAGSSGGANSSVAAYWKNGARVTLPEGSVANAIAVVGTDVYVGGATANGSAMYWKNGVATQLTNGASNATVSSVRGIAVSGSNVYAAGSAPDGDSGSVLTLWKDNVPTALPIPTNSSINGPTSGIANNLATSVSVFGGDVYTTGQVINNTTLQYASYYWKNGDPVQLPDGGNNGAFAYSIVAVPHAQ